MSAKLSKALEYANYRVTLNNQHEALKAKVQSLLSYSINGGTFTIDRELITFCKALISDKVKQAVLLDIYNNPIRVDLKDFYLNTPMKRYEYMRLKITDIPDEIVEEYNLQEKKTDDGYIYCEIRKGMYGLPQAGLLAQELLEERLAKHGYYQSATTPGFWKHKW